MAYYNAVLLPPEELSQGITRCAAFFSDIADGYCLSDKVFPHVTVYQFEAAGKLPDFKIAKSLPVFIGKFDTHMGEGIHEGHRWVDFEVMKTKEMLELQADVKKLLDEAGFRVLNKTGAAYRPHLTLCRLQKGADIPTRPMPSFPETLWRFAVGRSDRNGQFLGDI